jgi:2-polyprenyl-3-methyl-5-hydroxy-6-metoxy-1,4-benzoquinol methylase
VSRYDVTANGWGEGSSHAYLYEFARGAKSILDVGCSSGGLASALMANGSRVHGIDLDESAVAQARERGVDAQVFDLESGSISALYSDTRFECIIFGDVLEHVVDPGKILCDAHQILEADGYVVISIPNVSHASVALSLVTNRWDGRDVGLLDRTHLRFFTRDTIEDLVASTGYLISDLRRVISDVRDPSQTPTLAVTNVDLLSTTLVEAATEHPEASTLQFVLRLVPESGGVWDEVSSRELITRARVDRRDAEARAIALVDRVSQLEQERNALLGQLQAAMVSRDALIGLEATTGTLRRELVEANIQIASIREDGVVALQDVLSSFSWKVGRVLTAPLRLIRFLLRKSLK